MHDPELSLDTKDLELLEASDLETLKIASPITKVPVPIEEFYKLYSSKHFQNSSTHRNQGATTQGRKNEILIRKSYLKEILPLPSRSWPQY